MINIKKYIIYLVFILSTTITSCGSKKEEVVNLYSTRHYPLDEELHQEFTKKTGIKVNVLKSDPDSLLARMSGEKEKPQADLFFTADYARLFRAKANGLLEPVKTATLIAQTSDRYRDKAFYWYAMSYRLRIIAIDKNFKGTRPKTYEDLTNKAYKGKILVRSGMNAYNVSLIASLITRLGKDKTLHFIRGFVGNFARSPEGNDRKQVLDIYAGKGQIAILNSYYMGLMLNSVDPEIKKAAESVDLIYPKDTHLNISGFGMIKNAKNKANAIKLLEFLTSPYAQERITKENYEFPINPNIKATDVFLQWGDVPKIENIGLNDWGKYYEEAFILINKGGWK
ncbi:MAG: extracellular solute-binding protein [Brevinema sp.]